jgi:hypothetical protein
MTHRVLKQLAAATFLFALVHAAAAESKYKEDNFSGNWTIDLRSTAERKLKTDCGLATFQLSQTGKNIIGRHDFATPGCGRINEGFDGSVEGYVIGSTAVLTVTSGRNGAVFKGNASRVGRQLRWVVHTEIKPGEPEGDALVLHRGTLTRSKKKDPHQ